MPTFVSARDYVYYKSSFKNGSVKSIPVPLPASVVGYYFPKCYSFSETDYSDLLLIYGSKLKYRDRLDLYPNLVKSVVDKYHLDSSISSLTDKDISDLNLVFDSTLSYSPSFTKRELSILDSIEFYQSRESKFWCDLLSSEDPKVKLSSVFSSMTVSERVYGIPQNRLCASRAYEFCTRFHCSITQYLDYLFLYYSHLSSCSLAYIS